jgi:hypothetical protein
MDAIRHFAVKEAPQENWWITRHQVMEYEDISRQEVYRREERSHPHFLPSKPRDDGKPGLLFDARYLSPDAQGRLRRATLWKVAKHAPDPAQLSLLPGTDVDYKIAELNLSRSEKDVIWRRFRIVDLCLNHNWKAEGYASKPEYMAALGARNKTSKRSIQRWVLAWKQRENPLDLIADRRGPPPGTGALLDADMRAHLIDCWIVKKLTLRQCYRSLVNYLETKQNSVGCRVDHFYRMPSRHTVERFIRSLSPLDDAARQGADAMKAACGYIDRTYRDVLSLDRVCVDEWIVDALAFDPRHVSKVGRYYALIFLDERSIYPLVWSLVEQPNEQDELYLLCHLISEQGVPGLINSDRGRFRGRTFGGRFLNRDRAEMYKERDGILDRLDIARNNPREHNPRGNRLERFHLELANWARTLPGWCGSDTKQRRMTEADARVIAHKAWTKTGQGEPPLLSRDQLLERLNQFMAEFRQRPSDGNDMDGFAPEAVFRQNTPPGGFRRISDAELAWKTAEHFDVKIAKGGIVQLRDGKRYSDPELLLIQGEDREVIRVRNAHEQIWVLPSAKGEEAIIAKRRARVGVSDPDELANAMELLGRVRKVAGQFTKPLDYGSQFVAANSAPEPPKATQVIHPSEFMAAQEASEEPVPPLHDLEEFSPEMEIGSIGSVEWQAKGRGPRPKPWDFADLES